MSIVGRESNTGFTYFILNDTIVDNGGPPMRMEPVQAGIAIAGRSIQILLLIISPEGRSSAYRQPCPGRATTEVGREVRDSAGREGYCR